MAFILLRSLCRACREYWSRVMIVVIPIVVYVLPLRALADDPVAQMRDSMNAMEELSFFVKASVEAVNDLPEFGYADGDYSFELLRAGGLEKLLVHGRSGDAGSRYYAREYLVRPDKSVVHVQALFGPDGKQVSDPNFAPALMVMLSDAALAGADVNVIRKEKVHDALEQASVCVWRLGLSSLVEYVECCANEGRVEVDSGMLRGKGHLGSVEITFSPEHGFLPSSFHIVKSADSAYGSGAVREAFDVKLPAGLSVLQGQFPESPLDKPAAMGWRGFVHRFGQSDGIWYPQQVEIESYINFESGRSNTSVASVVLELAPGVTPEDCAIGFAVPLGYPVTVEGAPQLPFTWGVHGPEPGVPDFPDDAHYNPPPNLRSDSLLAPLIGLNLIALLLAGGYWFYLKHRGRAS